MEVVSRQEMRTLDRQASERLLIDEVILMENAGQAAVGVLIKETGDPEGKNFAVICGVGNNGGDGLVVARHLHSLKAKPQVFIMGNPDHFSGAAAKNWAIAREIPLPIHLITEPGELLRRLGGIKAIVDALFGTGINRPVEGMAARLIEGINSSQIPVLSLDLPSGINSDTGEIMGSAIRANWTVTFGRPKRGNLLYPGYDRGGKLYVAPISFPPGFVEGKRIAVSINEPAARPGIDPMAYKGSRGECLVIAGARSYCGAPLFCALSFLKAGGGYARLALPSSLLPVIASGGSEIVFLPQEETSAGSLARSNRDKLLDLATRMDSVIIGPGISLVEETAEMARELIASIDRPLIIDGDGLTALAADPACLQKRKSPTVLTPHWGEMARLVGRPHEEWSADRIGLLQRCCDKWRAIIVLKGPHSLIGYPDGRVYINLSGNPGMATAGAGDILPGIMAALAGTGLEWGEAVRAGVWLHGLAGDMAAREKGEEGMIARDILEQLPAAAKLYRRGVPQEMASKYCLPMAL